jgi:peptidoglycan-associated lipoprotein
MRTRYPAAAAGLLGVLLLLGAGCGKSIQANSGSKSFEPGAKRDVTTASLRTTSPAGGAISSGSRPSEKQPDAGRGAMTARAGDTGEVGIEPLSSTGEPTAPMPSLSAMDTSGPTVNGKRSDEQRVPGELLVAKSEPADSSRRRVEEMQREQIATAAAGLEDVFFSFDSWQITNEGKQTLMLNAEWMKANPARSVTIEGHCDERGTLAYNLVLGEKRAKAVQTYLMELGVNVRQLGVVSYGKERPFCKDHDESCYQKNRRGHLVLRAE